MNTDPFSDENRVKRLFAKLGEGVRNHSILHYAPGSYFFAGTNAAGELVTIGIEAHTVELLTSVGVLINVIDDGDLTPLFRQWKIEKILN
jgi:hypothetical protein